MIKGLRVRLTFLYLLVAVALMALVGGGAYCLLYYYFQNITDQALMYKMARVFRAYDLIPPPELAVTEANWLKERQRIFPLAADAHQLALEEELESEDEEADEPHALLNLRNEDIESDLAAMIILPLNRQGDVLLPASPTTSALVPDREAAAAAWENGSDMRYSSMKGIPVRILTYRFPQSVGYVIWQLGLPIDSHVQILGQFVIGMLIMSGAIVVVIGLGSWLLAGRTLIPAQRSMEQQQAFVANASHELRTPLTLIRASTEVAYRSTVTPDQHARLADVLQECDHMGKLIEDLLLLSRLDNRRLTLDKQPVFLPDFLLDIQRQFERLAETKAIDLVVNSCEGKIVVDPMRVRQVILILLDNAFQNTPRGGTIELSGQIKGGQFYFSVMDTGAGIPQEHLPRVFERFYKVNLRQAEETKGSGLGLSIAKALVEAHGGTIKITSEVSKCTQVIVSLPV